MFPPRCSRSLRARRHAAKGPGLTDAESSIHTPGAVPVVLAREIARTHAVYEERADTSIRSDSRGPRSSSTIRTVSFSSAGCMGFRIAFPAPRRWVLVEQDLYQNPLISDGSWRACSRVPAPVKNPIEDPLNPVPELRRTLDIGVSVVWIQSVGFQKT